MCSHVTTDAIIEMFVCARDGVTGWRNGGPSLTGKTEQEEQTPLLAGPNQRDLQGRQRRKRDVKGKRK